ATSRASWLSGMTTPGMSFAGAVLSCFIGFLKLEIACGFRDTPDFRTAPRGPLIPHGIVWRRYSGKVTLPLSHAKDPRSNNPNVLSRP
ncbi:hypothetical protein, partial [Paraburkholderia caribensis]|uniref:hypothetical protein n=1 Tax=Paraburkholderia caribensis TaxID=75105 RepID=UPI0034D273B4